MNKNLPFLRSASKMCMKQSSHINILIVWSLFKPAMAQTVWHHCRIRQYCSYCNGVFHTGYGFNTFSITVMWLWMWLPKKFTILYMSLPNYWMFDKVCYYLNMIYLLSFQQKEQTHLSEWDTTVHWRVGGRYGIIKAINEKHLKKDFFLPFCFVELQDEEENYGLHLVESFSLCNDPTLVWR